MKRSQPFLLGLLGLFASTGALLAQSVSGVVTYDGPDFTLRPLQMSADPACLELYDVDRVPGQDVLVSEAQGVANVFVYLEDAPEGVSVETPTEPVVMDQNGCLYSPRVLGIQVDQPLQIENGDPVLHNVRCLAKMNRPFNIGQPAGTPPRDKSFSRPEKAMKFKCDIHPWMSAYIFVMEHPLFAVTDSDGKFTIDGLPVGSYELRAWHERLGELKLQIEVDAEGMDSADFVFEKD